MQDLVTVRGVLSMFWEASELQVNYRLDNLTVKFLPRCEIGSFPCKCLGLQLSTRELNKVD